LDINKSIVKLHINAHPPSFNKTSGYDL